MYKLSQRELLEEGLWNKFKNSKIGRRINQGIQAGKEIAKAFAPKTTQQLGSMIDNTRQSFTNINQAKKTMAQLVAEWLDERGLIPISKIVEVSKYADGNSQWKVDVAKKGVDDNGKAVIAGKFKLPTAIILYNAKDKSFRFTLEPAQRRQGHEDEKNPEEEKINKEIEMLRKQKQLENLRKWKAKNSPASP